MTTRSQTVAAVHSRNLLPCAALTLGVLLASGCDRPGPSASVSAESGSAESSGVLETAAAGSAGAETLTEEVTETLAEASQAAGDAAEPADAAASTNLLIDPSFEQFGRDDEGTPWWNFKQRGSDGWVLHEITSERALDGERSAHLHMNSRSQPPVTAVHGVIQTLELDEVPQYLSGFYRVENWQRGAINQYVQVVVGFDGPEGVPVTMRGADPVQLAVTLFGIERVPFKIGNRKFQIRGELEPVEDEWVFFEADLHELFEVYWAGRPQSFERMHVYFELRYDGRQHGRGFDHAEADVYYDNLYLGPDSRADEFGANQDGSDE